MGDYFHEYTADGPMPELFAIVPLGYITNDTIPNEVLETYAFDEDDPILMAESFRLTGNLNLIHNYIEFSEYSLDSPFFCFGIIPPKPSEGCSCNYILYPKTITENEVIYAWKCPCSDPAVPNCVEPCYLEFQGTNWEAVPPAEVWKCICPMLPPGNTGVASVNDCGCPTFGSKTRPAGCVNVENTITNNFEGVEDIYIKVFKRFMIPRTTYTDNNGCWRINESFKGNVHVTVKFKNDDVFIRPGFLQPGVIIDYVGSTDGPDYRHFEANYQNLGEVITVIGTPGQAHWGAATINNELIDFKAGTTDIGTIPQRLDIVTLDDVTNGSAPMGTNVVSPSAITPDLIIGLFQADTEDMQDLLYHEFSHVHHYNQVGDAWWQTLAYQEIDNQVLGGGNPWGDGSETFAGHVAVAESWADFLMSDELGFDQENLLFAFGQHVPIGLYNDLIDPWQSDPTTLIPTVEDIGGTGFFDNVEGYTRVQLFSGLIQTTTNIETYREAIRPILPVGNTNAEFDEIFEAYEP